MRAATSNTAWPELWSRLLALLAAGLALVVARGARADQPLELGTALSGVALGGHVAALEDPSGTLQIGSLIEPRTAARFRPVTDEVPSFGFSSSVYWLRLTVENPDGDSRPWLLQLANPLLDDVTLFVPRADGGFEPRATGDMRPFRARDVTCRDFVFMLEEPAQGSRTYYLRVASSGTVHLPLFAWSLKDYLEHQQRDWFALWAFYGVLLVMACYNACVCAFARQREQLPYVGYVLSAGACHFTLAGHTFQFLLPAHPALVHRILPASACAILLFGCLIVLNHLPVPHALHRLTRLGAWYFLLLAGLSLVAPYDLMLHTITVSSVVFQVPAIATGFLLRGRGGNAWKLFLLGWSSSIAGGTVAALHSAGLLPANFLTTWAAQIGISLQLVLLSSELADRLNAMRTNLRAVNVQLSEQIVALRGALAQAGDATRKAERATRLKDEFMATMSHEFRTPLNPIINISLGLLQEFVPARYVVCNQCSTHFELEEGEQLSPLLLCPECQARGALSARESLKYVGSPERARRSLVKIERSGMQLLQIVNGILEFSKIQAGHVKLERESFETAPLVRELVEEFRGAAERRGLSLEGSCRLQGVLHADRRGIRQVLVHLIDNALKFSTGPGRVTVREQATSEGHLFSVSDQGIGIAREHWQSIFASFEQISKGNTRRYGGVGLGLSIAHAWVRMHGGVIWVESEPGRGSTFYVNIPHSEPSAAKASSPLVTRFTRERGAHALDRSA